MIRLHIIVEGQTEEKFVNDILAPHLALKNVFACASRILTSRDKNRGKQYKGGVPNYDKARNDILIRLKSDTCAECRVTTMFDFYALPTRFPQYSSCKSLSAPDAKVEALEKAFAEDICDDRFIPYIQLHEFEALILANPQKLDWEYLEHDAQISNLVAMVGEQNPEHINDNVETAPSKRILKEIPEYDKVSAGVSVVQQIGLATLREKCPHFGAWLTKLENLASESHKEA